MSFDADMSTDIKQQQGFAQQTAAAASSIPTVPTLPEQLQQVYRMYMLLVASSSQAYLYELCC
jgi:hypothetical protein